MAHARGTFEVKLTLFVPVILALALVVPAARAQSGRYLEAGVPAPSREWNGADYERAVQILGDGKVPLPRFADPQGAALLRRFTSTENFGLHHDKSLSLQARMEDYLKMYQATASLLKLYYAAPAVDGTAPHQELAALVAFLLQGAALGGELADELLPTIPKDDQYETRMAGLKQMNAGFTTVFMGAEQTLGDSRTLSAEDRSVILRAMESTLPRLKKAFPDDVRVELRKKLEEDKARFSGPEDLQRLGAMIHEIAA